MDPITAKLMSAAGAAADKVYVDDVFSTFLYDGTGSAQTINNGIDLSGEGGAVWIKNRSNSNGHRLVDTERGATESLEPHDTNANATESQGLTAFTSTGFSVGTQTHFNNNGNHLCSWTFRKAPGFFDVVTYTGNGSHRDISHSLGSEPGSIWIKRTDGDESWIVYHRSLDQGGGSGATAHMAGLELDSNGAQYGGTLRWSSSGGGEDHTATTFHVSGHSAINGSGMTYVAYIFAHDDQSFGDAGNESIIKCGSYTGTGSDGNFVNVGFEPQWILLKSSAGYDGPWVINDVMRGMANVDDNSQTRSLKANQNSAESNDIFSPPYSNGFVVNGTGAFKNGNGNTYVYIAIRRPHKPPSAGTDVFKPNTYTGNGSLLSITGIGFPPDFSFTTRRDTASWITTDKLRGPSQSLFAQSTDAEVNQGIYEVRSYDQDGITYGQNSSVNGSGVSLVHHLFRRAPGFFDVVAYTGTGSTNNINHNLGVVPELMLIKSRNGTRAWRVYDANTGANGSLRLNSDAAKDSNSAYWSTPTADNIILGTDNDTNSGSYNYIAYLFATLPGISKVGTFSGTGSDINVDCGFTAGARFVMIKRTDSSGDWYVWDSARGIVSGNDPYLRLNSTGAEVANTDYIDPLNAGFTVTSLYNQSEVWSGYPKTGTQPAGAEWTKAFDGNLANGVYPNTNITTTLTIDVSDRPTWSSSIRIYGVNYGGVVTINGTNVTSATSGSLGWFDLTSLLGSSGTLASFSLTNPGGNYAKINAVELDGKQLVDTGVSVTPSPVNTSGGTYIFLAIA